MQRHSDQGPELFIRGYHPDPMFPEREIARIDATYALVFSVLFRQSTRLRDTSHQEERKYHLLAKFHSMAVDLS